MQLPLLLTGGIGSLHQPVGTGARLRRRPRCQPQQQQHPRRPPPPPPQLLPPLPNRIPRSEASLRLPSSGAGHRLRRLLPHQLRLVTATGLAQPTLAGLPRQPVSIAVAAPAVTANQVTGGGSSLQAATGQQPLRRARASLSIGSGRQQSMPLMAWRARAALDHAQWSRCWKRASCAPVSREKTSCELFPWLRVWSPA